MTMRTPALCALAGLLLPFCAVPACGQSTFYIVRHAEKASVPGERDPELTAAGRARARELARVLRSVKIDVVLSTAYKRTTATVTPAAATRRLAVGSYAPKMKAEEAARLVAQKKTFLVAGHSNTVPMILEALGVKGPHRKLDENDYDNLFVVHVAADGRVLMQHLHYGAVTTY